MNRSLARRSDILGRGLQGQEHGSVRKALWEEDTAEEAGEGGGGRSACDWLLREIHGEQWKFGGSGQKCLLMWDVGQRMLGKYRVHPPTLLHSGFPCGSDGKEPACSAGHPCLIPGSGRSPGGGSGNPLQYSCLKKHTDRGARRATVHGSQRVGHA